MSEEQNCLSQYKAENKQSELSWSNLQKGRWKRKFLPARIWSRTSKPWKRYEPHCDSSSGSNFSASWSSSFLSVTSWCGRILKGTGQNRTICFQIVYSYRCARVIKKSDIHTYLVRSAQEIRKIRANGNIFG